MIKILLIEDDKDCAYAIQGGLELLDKYEVAIANDGMEGLEMFDQFMPDVVVTDIEMPKMDGFDLVKEIRAKNISVIIIMESGRTSPKDVIKGYKLGVDDYIKKPFVAEELHVHIEAVLKRIRVRDQKDLTNCHYIGSYKFDFEQGTLELEMQKQRMTKRETEILKLLYDNKNKIVPRDTILIDLWGSIDYFNARSLAVFLTRLRKYLKYDSSIQITSVKRVGIKLEA